MQQNLHLHKPITSTVSPETVAEIQKRQWEKEKKQIADTMKHEGMAPVNPTEIPALLMQALAQLVVTAAEMVETLSEIADSHDELVWLAEKAAIRQGIVTQEQINEQNKEEPESTAGADRV